MIVFYADRGECWMALGNGPLRNIIAEGQTRKQAVKEYGELYQYQIAEEYAFEQAMSQLAMEQPYGNVQVQ